MKVYSNNLFLCNKFQYNYILLYSIEFLGPLCWLHNVMCVLKSFTVAYSWRYLQYACMCTYNIIWTIKPSPCLWRWNCPRPSRCGWNACIQLWGWMCLELEGKHVHKYLHLNFNIHVSINEFTYVQMHLLYLYPNM